MLIHFTRDSVCVGDDYFDSSRDYEFALNDSWDKIMSVIKENHFLASISGNNVVWVLQNNNGEEILSYFTSRDVVVKCTTKTLIQEICGESLELAFKYYISPQQRGMYIFKLNGESQYAMWHDGWIEEYRLCEVSKKLENEWKES